MDERAALADDFDIALQEREKNPMYTLHPARFATKPVIAAALLACLAATGAQAAPPVLAGYTLVHSMQADNGTDGIGPTGALTQSRGTDANFYGSNFYLGAADFRCGCNVGGTVFKMNAKGSITPLHTFNGTDGSAPSTDIVQGADKAWYGMTAGGGTYDGGTVFKVTGDGLTFTSLHSFGGVAGDGNYPSGGALVAAPDGNFYGTTMGGGTHGLGVAFRMTPAGAVTVIHEFAGAPGDGASPRGGLTLGSDGNLYGVTVCGATTSPGLGSGCGGTVYRISTAGVYTLLHSFDTKAGGYQPLGAPVEIAGTLYGTTTGGGTSDFGTVWKVALGGTGFATMYSFAGGVNAAPANDDGARPAARLLVASDGNLYGTTSNGGPNTQIFPKGDGTIFRITPAGAYTLLGVLGQVATDGSHPVTGLTMGKDGFIYGTTDNGGANQTGTVFKFPVPAL
jgi:uncharacterized repeat protein (TIGR03803 family)